MAAVRNMKTTPKESPAMTGTHQKGADLDDHLEDGACADRQCESGPLRSIGEAADPQAEHGRAAGKEGEAGETPQRRPFPEDRRGDADALGYVVQRETQHQERAEPGRTGREGGTYRQPFAQIVQADAERDECRQGEACRRSAAPADRDQQEKTRDRSKHDHDVALEDRGSFAGKFERFADGVDEEERE